MRQAGGATFAPVGATLQNGMDAGGARIYPFSTGLAVTPPAYYSDYIGSAQGLPVAPPAAALSATSGVGTNTPSVANAMAHPFSKYSPLPWVILGLFGAVAATHLIHYAEKKR